MRVFISLATIIVTSYFLLLNMYQHRLVQIIKANFSTATIGSPHLQSALPRFIINHGINENLHSNQLGLDDALAVDPANAYLWSRYAISLWNKKNDSLAAIASAHALQLAINTPSINLEQAILGGRLGNRANSELQHRFRRAAVLTFIDNPAFVKHILIQQQSENAFCQWSSASKSLMQWCKHVKAHRLQCSSAKTLPSKIKRRCKKHGLLNSPS